MSVASLLTLATEGSPSTEIPFFVIGGVFAAWALLIGGLGTARASFPGGRGAVIAICGTSVLLAAAAMTLIIVVTS